MVDRKDLDYQTMKEYEKISKVCEWEQKHTGIEKSDRKRQRQNCRDDNTKIK